MRFIQRVEVANGKTKVYLNFSGLELRDVIDISGYISRIDSVEVLKVIIDGVVKYDETDPEAIHPEMAKEYKEVLSRFEDWYLKGKKFEKKIADERSVVYVIEDSLIVMFTIQRSEHGQFLYLSGFHHHYYRLILEEFTYNGVYELYKSSFHSRTGTWDFLDYRPFFDKTKSKEKSISLIETKFPSIGLRKRISDWEGLTFYFCMFETCDESGKIGRAAFYSDSELTPAEIHRITSEMQDRLVAEYLILARGRVGLSVSIREAAKAAGVPPEKEWLLSSRAKTDEYDKYDVCCDDEFKRIIFERIARKKDASDVEYRNDKPIFFDNRVKYATFERKYRDPAHVKSSTILAEASRGKHADVELIEFTPVVGKWKNEELMYRCIQSVFKGETVLYQHSPVWLGQQSFDVFVPLKNTAFEYQGQQHFEPVDFFGGEESHANQVARDKRKKKLSKEHGVTLIYVNYWEDVNEGLILEKLKEAKVDM